MSLQIGKAIYSLLNANENLVAKTGNKIFPLISEIDTTFPFIIYKRTSVTPIYTKDYLTEDELTVEVVVASDKYNEAVEIADLVRDSLEGKKGTYSDLTIKSIRMKEADEDYTQDTFIQNLNFIIKVYGKRN